MKTTSEGRLTKAKLSRLVKKLKEGDNYEKEKSIEQLTAFPDKKVVESVIPLLKEKDTQVRMAAWEILKRTGSSHIDAVVALLDDDNEDIRIYAVEILGGLRNGSTIPDLIRKTLEENPNVRNIACQALGGFDDERAVDALLNALKDDEWIVFSAIESLGRIGNRRAVLPLLNVFKNGSEEISMAACEVLISFHDEAVLDEMFGVLKGLEQKTRNAYLKVILEKGDEDAFHRAKERIGDELFTHLLTCVELEEKKSPSLLRKLVTFKRQEACDAVLNAIKTMNPEDEEEYGESIHIFTSLKEVWENRVAEYMEKDEGYVLPLIRACQMAGVRVDEKALLKVFLSSTVDIKREIAKGLPTIVGGSGLLVIKEAMKDLDGHVKGDAMITAGVMSLNELKGEIEAAAVRDFHDVRIKALNALIRLDSASALDLIRNFVQDGTGDDKRVYLAVAGFLNGESNLPFIKKLLSDNDEKVRSAAASALGNFLDDERYMSIFVKQLKARDIPHEVLKVIKERRLTVFKERLQEIFEDTGRGLWTRYYALSALSSFEDGSLFDTFAGGLGDENSIIKIGCLKALSDLNDARARDYVLPFIQSDDEDIRSTAEFVMDKLEAF